MATHRLLAACLVGVSVGLAPTPAAEPLPDTKPLTDDGDLAAKMVAGMHKDLDAAVVAVPDADRTPEQVAGLAPGVPAESQFARRLAESGCRVLVPTPIDRRDELSANPRLNRATNQPHREFVHRMAYEMGRTLPG